eukprot:759392-Hanusia_phi.AAC.1
MRRLIPRAILKLPSIASPTPLAQARVDFIVFADPVTNELGQERRGDSLGFQLILIVFFVAAH